MGYYRTSIEQDAYDVGLHLRDADRDEAAASTGQEPVQSLLAAHLSTNPCLTMVNADGTPVGMFGIVPQPALGAALVWAVATDEIFKHPVEFTRKSREWVKASNLSHPVLFNFVDERNIAHIQWLKVMGFTFIQRHPVFGVEGRPFIEFVRITHV